MLRTVPQSVAGARSVPPQSLPRNIPGQSEGAIMRRNPSAAIPVIAVLLLNGCGREASTTSPPSATSGSVAAPDKAVDSVRQIDSVEQLSASQQEQHTTALAARDALFTRLSGRLTSVIEQNGPAAAIDVCRAEAPAMAEQVKQEFGVDIGRTSFRLRNSMNPAPDWATDFVTEQVDSPRLVALADETLGVLLPIRLQQKCVVCHGTEDQIPADVQAALKRQYPGDQATGFHENDLRGWFWVEVPAPAADGAPE
ncbi:MAG: DUF3365 domain-containing protein [Planctomycetaceae bacterium]